LSGTLWPDTCGQRSAKNLRSVLWRLRALGVSLIKTHDERLRLDADVTVDIAELTTLAHRLIHHPDAAAFAGLPSLIANEELLPDWDDEWIVTDRERYRLMRLDALEHAAGELKKEGCFSDALMAATAAVQTEPLRETARRIVVEIHLAQGNIAAAIAAYRQYERLLSEEFGVAPSPNLTGVVAPYRSDMKEAVQ
jgi:DNA-binding SARP family transcriptional activator